MPHPLSHRDKRSLLAHQHGYASRFGTREEGASSEYYRGNTTFFNDYSKHIVDNPIAIRQIYEGLINFNVDEIIPSGNFQQDKPTTEIEKEVKQHNREKVLYFIEDIVNSELVNELEFIKYRNRDLFDKWLEWSKSNNIKCDMNNIQFGLKLSHLIHLPRGIRVGVARAAQGSRTQFHPRPEGSKKGGLRACQARFAELRRRGRVDQAGGA